MSALPNLADPTPDVPRDHWQRPLIVPVAGGKALPYTRTTTYVSSIDDRMALERWKMRTVAKGLALRKDLLLAVAAHREDNGKVDGFCQDALEAAGGGAAAITGTALHSLTEQMDRGQQVSVPEEYLKDLAAYASATTELQALYIEQMTVQDSLKVAGTPDRIVKYKGERYIADVKTGSIEYGHLTIAAQLAMYARSCPYDVGRGIRLEPHQASLDRGIVIHLPAGKGTCQLYWVDLQLGWEVVRLCQWVRDMRKRRFPEVMRQLHDIPAAPITLADRINLATTPDAVRALWAANSSAWTDDLTALARQRIAAIEQPHHLTPTT